MQKGIENKNTNTNAALAYFMGAIKVDSLFCDAYDYAAEIFIKKEKYDSALKYINLSLTVNAANRSAGKTKIRLHFILKEYKEAGDFAFARHLKQPDEGLWLYYLAESLFHRDLLDSAKATTLKMQMVMQQQENEFAASTSMYLQGKIFCKMKEYNIAQKALKQVKQEYRKDAEFNYYLGLTYIYGEKPNEKKAKRYIIRAFKKGFIVPQQIASELNI